jgi:hypothetical protein
VEFSCKNCGSTKMNPVALSPADRVSPLSPLEVAQMPPVSVQISRNLAGTPH